MSENQTPPPIQVSASETRTWNMFCHLSALAGFVFPFGNILGPLFIWERKKKQIPSVDVHGKSSLNFQLTFSMGLISKVTLKLKKRFPNSGIDYFFGFGADALIVGFFASSFAARLPLPLPIATAARMSLKVPLIGGIIFCGLLIRVFVSGFYTAIASFPQPSLLRRKTHSAFHAPAG